MSNFRSSPFWDKDAMTQAVTDASSCKEALTRLGYTGRVQHYYPTLRAACVRYGLPYPAKITPPKERKISTRSSKFDDLDLVKQAVKDAPSVKVALESMGMATAKKNYIRLLKVCEENGIEPPPLRPTKYPSKRKNKDPEYFSREVFVNALNESSSQSELCNKLGVSRRKQWIKDAAAYHEVHLPDEFFRDARLRVKPLEYILVENSQTNNQVVKQRIVSAGLVSDVCAECGMGPKWNGKPLTLQLDHVNGVPSDNRLSNLRILCPNCHTQTHTYGGKRRDKVPARGFEPPHDATS